MRQPCAPCRFLRLRLFCPTTPSVPSFPTLCAFPPSLFLPPLRHQLLFTSHHSFPFSLAVSSASAAASSASLAAATVVAFNLDAKTSAAPSCSSPRSPQFPPFPATAASLPLLRHFLPRHSFLAVPPPLLLPLPLLLQPLPPLLQSLPTTSLASHQSHQRLRLQALTVLPAGDSKPLLRFSAASAASPIPHLLPASLHLPPALPLAFLSAPPCFAARVPRPLTRVACARKTRGNRIQRQRTTSASDGEGSSLFPVAEKERTRRDTQSCMFCCEWIKFFTETKRTLLGTRFAQIAGALFFWRAGATINVLNTVLR
eukprot:SAG31_NODE_1051_length_10157_cov_203.009048_9_plen_314_part_00